MRSAIILIGFIIISSFGGSNLLPGKFRIPIVLDFELKIGEQKLVLTKQQEKDVKSYYKEKNFLLSVKNRLRLSFKNKWQRF